ncbi:tumor necrosis factor receptor superfamily member 14-like isoform X2 [Anoplopoma fimbria]|uniref:tumor necrosis factor receptor superfamily member 14-like isoform X2 n=1 Tax=Anoplopoma fimbria TaxID=229290 RepID=UPI0023EC2AF8|nr:tumor necrosis factor receptor superfamily member 14-like isoform X2 [Anoplopoma fimbria]
MFPTLTVFGFVAIFMTPGLCCSSKEYETRDGWCCPMCQKGLVVQINCTLQEGTQCIPCVNGTFMNRPNGQNKCNPCTSCDQGNGLFAKQGCTAATDTVCDVVNGYFCKAFTDESGCSSAEKHTQCGPGHRIKAPGTSRTDTVCESCPAGYFLLDGVNCTVWTLCSQTQMKIKEGNTTSDVVCEAASRHHYFLIAALILFTLTGAGFGIKGGLSSSKKKKRKSSTI